MEKLGIEKKCIYILIYIKDQREKKFINILIFISHVNTK